MGFNTGYKNSAGVDIGAGLVELSYLIDRYPELADTFRFAGAWSVGTNTLGALGDNTLVNKSSPVQTIAGGTNWKQIDASNAWTAAIKADGTLWTWGYNNRGMLGDNTTVNTSSPIQTVSGGTNWKQVSSGAAYASAIKTDGTLWLWGYNLDGELGDNTATNKSSPVQTVSGGTNWKQVSSGTSVATHTAAIKTDGTLWLWGLNNNGQLGDNTVTPKSSPVQTVSGGTNWKQVACGNIVTAAIKTDGTLWTWGRGDTGMLGNNTTVIGVSSPIQTISGGTNWKVLTCGSNTTAAIKTDGTLWLWGFNNYGQLGDNTTVQKNSPVQTVAGGTNWKQVVAKGTTTAAIKTDGTLWLWGKNNAGSLGDGVSLNNRSSPIQTISGGTNWRQVSTSGTHTSAIRDDSGDLL